ncbi:methyltransferase FkbM family [[Leptolyngbya] sp. PCC 7376]|uniref:FkbM family methyltransferase n=1 Tax=[Leptolyngbya] sp. PCC 7376 TaxID=111781 RepID=UPI00029EC630|nr:FkbM family methyltransferase [[Leptolyngbya] sp. PCC 7376]AFY39779.1 methyltransferase FkbM family [[Leptolyngbya] sp. PCC 7376]
MNIFEIPIVSSLIFLARYFTDKSAFKSQKKLITLREPTIFDVGAHVGQTAKQYRRFFPKSKIYSFEPFPDSFEKLQAKYQKDQRVFPQNVAVSETSGRLSLNVNSDAATNSVLPIADEGKVCWGDRLKSKDNLEVKSVSIDDFCAENLIHHIDILKLDLQGHELAALKGAKTMLQKQAVDLVYLELLVSKSYENQPQLHEYLTLFAEYDYKFLDFYSPIRKGVQLIQCDLIFVSQNLNDKILRSIKKGGFSTS